MITWLGETDEDLVTIAENPETGEKEHVDYKWLKPEDLRKNCLDYLGPTLIWAEKKVWEYLKT